MDDFDDDFEMNELNEEQREELREQEEDETSFTNLMNKSVLIPDGSNPYFVVRPTLSNLADDFSFAKGDFVAANAKKKSEVTNEKKVLLRKFGHTLNKGAGPVSKELFDMLVLTLQEKTGFVNGAKFLGKKILLVTKGGKYKISETDANAVVVNKFNELVRRANIEYDKSAAKIIEKENPGVNLPGPVIINIVDDAVETIQEKKEYLINTIEDLLKTVELDPEEQREIRGLLYKNINEIIQSGNPDLVAANQKTFDMIEKKLYAQKALEAFRLNDVEKGRLYREVVKIVEMNGDELRLGTGQKPVSEEVINILKKAAVENDLSRLERFKKWSKENMLGLSAIAITIAGLLTTILVAGKTVIKAGASALGEFGKAVASIAKNFGPLIAALGSIIGTIISAGAKSLLWLSRNMWLLAVGLAYFVYTEYKRK